MANQLKKGDLVKLKSGGPQMTVEGEKPVLDDNDAVVGIVVACVWFDKNDSVQRSDFIPETLVTAGKSAVASPP